MPHAGTVHRWLAEDRSGFCEQYARACQQRAEYWVEEIIEIADSDDDPNSRRVRVDARKWIACKLLPRKYGDKLDMTSGGEKIESADQIAARVLAGLPGGRRDMADTEGGGS